MESLIFFGLLAIVGLAALWALLQARPVLPPVICVVTESAQAQGGLGCLPLVIAGIVIIVALRVLAGG